MMRPGCVTIPPTSTVADVEGVEAPTSAQQCFFQADGMHLLDRAHPEQVAAANTDQQTQRINRGSMTLRPEF
ncbi:MAG: hypothetical protein QM775_08685 [Pirellulales bacterium]